MRSVFRLRTLAFVSTLLVSGAWWPASAQAETSCTLFAAPFGSDTATGTEPEPFASVGHLVDALGPGQTGCLFEGTYIGDVNVARGGVPDAPLTLTSRPGGRATLRGRLWIADGATDVVVAGLNLDGRSPGGLPSPTVNGDRIVFRDNDVTNYHTGICFVLGSTSGWGTAEDVVLERNRIHDCGRIPATNHDHGIYVESARRARIVDNLIHDNADRGIQLYPDAQETVIAHNVIDGNGEGIIFSGQDGLASSGNHVTANVLANAVLRFNVESWWPVGNPVGTGNVVDRNCLWNGHRGDVGPETGFVTQANVVADPQFRDRAARDFALLGTSPCADMGPRSELRVDLLPALAPRKLRVPRIVGKSRRLSVLRVRPGSWGGSSPLRFHYRWRRCDARGKRCTSIWRARGDAAYRLSRRDVGHTIRAVVLVRNPAGARTSVSRRTSPVKG